MWPILKENKVWTKKNVSKWFVRFKTVQNEWPKKNLKFIAQNSLKWMTNEFSHFKWDFKLNHVCTWI